MMTKRVYTWYVHCDSRANESLASFLNAQGVTAEESTKIIKVDEKPFPVWVVKHNIVMKLKEASKNFNFKFFVYVQQGGGEPRKWGFLNKGKLSRTKEVKRLSALMTKQKQKLKPKK